jgi:hypothetical protein
MSHEIIELYEDLVELKMFNADEMKGKCPFHDDKTPSLLVNRNTGQWYCFACTEGGGPVRFIEKYYDVSEKIAQYAVDFYRSQGTLPFPSDEELEGYEKELQQQETVHKWLNDIGIVDSCIAKRRLGWDKAKTRVTIPVFSRTGLCVNIRYYMPPGSKRTPTTAKTTNHTVREGSKIVVGLGDNRYYPVDAFTNDHIYLVEGEKDCLVAESQGLNAVTSTGGTNIPMDYIQQFRDKNVLLMLDADDAGLALVAKYKNLLQSIAKSITLVRLPVKDFAEFYEQYNSTTTDYPQELSRYYDILSKMEDISNEKTVHVKLRDSLGVDKVDTTMELRNMKITGKHFCTYTIPKGLKINCQGVGCKKKDCAFREVEYEFAVECRDLVSLMKSPDSAMPKLLKMKIGCNKADMVVEQFVIAQIINFQEDVSMMSTDDYWNQTQVGVFLFDNAPLETNKTYNFTAIRTTDPKTQQIIYIILDAVECALNINVDLDQLRVFSNKASAYSSCMELLESYYEQWKPHLEVYGRLDLFIAILLTYTSSIGFYWNNTLVKGWLDTLIIGDTRTGKSKLVKNFKNTLGLGTYVSGENARKTGIVGGVQKIGDNWSLSWGVVPLNDKRLVVVDEASGLTVEDLQEMSQMRSEGIICITKIISETTTARTRLIWLTNPRSGKNVTEYYWKAVDAVKEFLPVQEDLARFDLVTTASLVDVDNIHQYSNQKPPMNAEELNLWRQLVIYAWQLQPEQVVINNDIRDYIVDISDTLSESYSSYLPLFLKTNGYEKLARLAISIAILSFNADVKGNIIVTKDHVDAAKSVIQMCYSKKSFEFDVYSERDIKTRVVTDEKRATIRNLLKIFPNMRILFESTVVKSFVIQEVLGIDHDESRRLIATLVGEGFVKMTNHGYKATPQFLDMLRQAEKV